MSNSASSSTYYCPHCKEVSKATFFRYRLRYFINGQWMTDCVEEFLFDDFDNERDRSDIDSDVSPHTTLNLSSKNTESTEALGNSDSHEVDCDEPLETQG